MTMTRRQALAGLAAGLTVPALAGCQVSPGTGREHFNIVSADEERQMGQQSHPKLMKAFGGAYDDPGLQAYVAGIGQHLVNFSETPQADFRFTVLNSPVVNAMALPGGYVYVTRGLLSLTTNEAELAGVIGHEIGHVTARHSAQRYSRSMAANLGLSILGAVVGVPGVADVAGLGASYWLSAYSQENELESDALGVRYVSKAGWNAGAMATMLEHLRDHARLEAMLAGKSPDSVDEVHFMATHPRTIDRVRAAIEMTLGAPPQGALNQDTFFDHVDGMVWGDDPAQGVVRGTSFQHPGLGFAFSVPQGFVLTNGDDSVTASDGNGAAIIFDGGNGRGVGDLSAYLRSWMSKSSLSNGETFRVDGMEAATATTRGRTRQGQVDVRLVVIRFDADTLFRFTFVSPTNRTGALAQAFKDSGYSFRRLDAAERAAIKPLRIKVVRVATGDTVESLAGRMAVDRFAQERFRLLNALKDGEQPRPGQRVRIIV